MAQIFNTETNIGDLTKASATSVQLAASTVPVGGKQYSFSNLVCDLTTNGAGGLDTGSLSISKPYFLYVVIDSGTPKLIASLDNNSPLGFSTNFKIGAFGTDSSSEVDFVIKKGVLYKNSKKVIGTTNNSAIPTSYATVPEMSVTMPIFGGKVSIFGTADFVFNGTTSDTNSLRITIDGNPDVSEANVQSAGNEFNQMNIHGSVENLSIDSHTFELEWRRSSQVTTGRLGISRWLVVEEYILIN